MEDVGAQPVGDGKAWDFYVRHLYLMRSARFFDEWVGDVFGDVYGCNPFEHLRLSLEEFERYAKDFLAGLEEAMQAFWSLAREPMVRARSDVVNGGGEWSGTVNGLGFGGQWTDNQRKDAGRREMKLIKDLVIEGDTQMQRANDAIDAGELEKAMRSAADWSRPWW